MAKYSSKAYMSTKDAKINTLISLPENIGMLFLLILRIIIRRGTCNIADWTNELNCILTKHHMIIQVIHRGYLETVWNILKLSEFKEIERAIYAQKNRGILAMGIRQVQKCYSWALSSLEIILLKNLQLLHLVLQRRVIISSIKI